MAGSTFTGPLKIRDSSGTEVTFVDENGNIDAPLTTSNITASGDTTLGDAEGDTISLNSGVVKFGLTAEELSGAGAVSITNPITHVVTTGANALTLADGSEGQWKAIVMKTDAGAGTLTPTNLGNGSTITFDDVGDSAWLLFTNGAWHFMGGTATLA